MPDLIERDAEEQLVPGIFVLKLERPDGTEGDVLFAPTADLILPITPAQAAMLSEHSGNPSVTKLLVEALTHSTIDTPHDDISDLASYSPTSVALMLTTTCQLRCTYCYADAGNTPSKHLAESVALRAIDFIIGNAIATQRPGVIVHFHGAGEPTLRQTLIETVLDYSRAQCATNKLV